jgi:hypothetical protein
MIYIITHLIMTVCGLVIVSVSLKDFISKRFKYSLLRVRIPLLNNVLPQLKTPLLFKTLMIRMSNVIVIIYHLLTGSSTPLK